MRVAIVHDWLTGMRGGEYVLEAIAEIFPRANLFTLLYIPGKISPVLTTLRRNTSWLQKVPYIEKRYRNFLPLMPCAIEKFDLRDFDLVLSSSHCVAKGVRKRKDAVHISYIHAPMRYMWDRYDDYFGPGRAAPHVRLLARAIRNRMQKWDRETSSTDRIDNLIANSSFISEQIRRHYGRDSEVVHPFADIERFTSERKPSRNYIIVSAFAPYKRIDIAIEAFNKLELPLIIVGAGQEERNLQKIARSNIDFVGSLSNAAIADLYAKSRALIFPGVEDFGITPVEAMAAGSPVIAYRAGGVLDTVTEKTGIFFDKQTPDALAEAVMKFETGKVRINEEDCRLRAKEFTRQNFQQKFICIVRKEWTKAGKNVQELDELISRGWLKAT